MRRQLTLLVPVIAALTAVGLFAAFSPPPSARAGASVSVLQMNLCLSGLSDCYDDTNYPAVVDEAAVQVAAQDADVVTLNEACSGDAADLARRTGYRMRFTVVRYAGAPLPCVEPGGRGVFGLGVLTRDDVRTTESRAFASQADEEERRWMCVTTTGSVTVCTAHLSTRDTSMGSHANDAACAELREVLTAYAAAGTTVFGGDVNRQESCAPAAMWSSGDASADQAPGVQHVYGSRSLDEPAAQVTAATYTDHDFLLVAALGR